MESCPYLIGFLDNYFSSILILSEHFTVVKLSLHPFPLAFGSAAEFFQSFVGSLLRNPAVHFRNISNLPQAVSSAAGNMATAKITGSDQTEQARQALNVRKGTSIAKFQCNGSSLIKYTTDNLFSFTLAPRIFC